MADEMTLATFWNRLDRVACARAVPRARWWALWRLHSRRWWGNYGGRPKYATVDGRVHEMIERLRAARTTLAQLIEDDERAFQGVTAAYKLPKAADDERTKRCGNTGSPG